MKASTYFSSLAAKMLLEEIELAEKAKSAEIEFLRQVDCEGEGSQRG